MGQGISDIKVNIESHKNFPPLCKSKVTAKSWIIEEKGMWSLRQINKIQCFSFSKCSVCFWDIAPTGRENKILKIGGGYLRLSSLLRFWSCLSWKKGHSYVILEKTANRSRATSRLCLSLPGDASRGRGPGSPRAAAGAGAGSRGASPPAGSMAAAGEVEPAADLPASEHGHIICVE